uniref:Aph phosphorylate n=1 Tax=Mycena chlorophos TaxID=658473 RepID=A0ABQ0M7K5_MYCCL|nr:aph phosphorylate [Mycena chlorophos]
MEREVKAILERALDIELPHSATGIQPINRGYNNHLFLVDLPVDEICRLHRARPPPLPRQPGTVPLPTSTQKLVVRILKKELGGLLERVENEVAALALVRGPLASIVRVPEVYAWSLGQQPPEDAVPFLVLEYLEANILKSLQSIPLPVADTPTAKPFGGFAFTPSGDITTTLHPDGLGGPFASAEAMWLSKLATKLRDADTNSIIQGWKTDSGGLRARLDAFIASDTGFQAILRNVATEPVLVHGDFDFQNMLVAPDIHRITALLDFEFARIATLPEEFIDGLAGLPSHKCGDSIQDPSTGAPTWPCESLDSAERDDECRIAMAWQESFPVQIPGYTKTRSVCAFLDDICPWYFCQAPWRASHDMPIERRKTEERLDAMLAAWGF